MKIHTLIRNKCVLHTIKMLSEIKRNKGKKVYPVLNVTKRFRCYKKENKPYHTFAYNLIISSLYSKVYILLHMVLK